MDVTLLQIIKGCFQSDSNYAEKGLNTSFCVSQKYQREDFRKFIYMYSRVWAATINELSKCLRLYDRVEFPYFGYFIHDGPRVAFLPFTESDCRHSSVKFHKIQCSDIDNSMQLENGKAKSILQQLSTHSASLARQGGRIKLNLLIGSLFITSKGSLFMYEFN
jgi:hypothetical protein